MSRLIKYPIEIRKEGYEFLPINQGGEDRLKQWTGKNTVITQTFKNKKELILLPRNAHPDAPMIKQNYEQDTWISFYRLAQTTGLAINKPLPVADIQAQIIAWFNKHGISQGETFSYEEINRDIIAMNDIFLARNEGNADELSKLVKESTMFDGMVLKIVIEPDFEGKIDPYYKPIGYIEALILDFLFSSGVLEKWFTCKHCGTQFQHNRKKDYCSPTCKSRAAYLRRIQRGEKS